MRPPTRIRWLAQRPLPGYVSSHPDVKLVVTDHGGLTATAETYLKAAGKKPGEIHIAGFDLSPATVAAMKGGWTELVIDQQPWLQGYLPILQTLLDQGVWLLGPAHRHRRWLREQGQHRLPRAAGREENPLSACAAIVGADSPIGLFAPTRLGVRPHPGGRAMDYVLQMKNISKTFGEVQALHNVNFEVGTNEIVGLLGDNGAGKSTLVKTITGYHQPDPGGELYWKGERLEHTSVAKMRKLGVQVVYQERALADLQSLWRNIFMGRELTKRLGVLDVKKMRRETPELMSEAMGFTSSAITPESSVKHISGGERQGVAITRALYFQAELIILDEPTMGLSLSETKKTLEFVAGIKQRGKAAIFIDHNIFHVYPVVDRIVVVDRGTIAGQFLKSEITLDELIERLYRVAQTGSLNNGGQ